jgi:hypothetical protein
MAESGLAALGNHNVEADIQACIALWRLSTLRGPCILRTSSNAGIKCSDRSARELQKYGRHVDHSAKTTLPNGRSSIRWRKASPVSPRE